jgi:hypothetical protein
VAQYSDKRVPLITVFWPGNEQCEKEPLRGIYHSSYDGRPQFEYSGSTEAGNETAFADFLHEFADALRAYQVKSTIEEIEAAEAKRETKRETKPPRKAVGSQAKKGRVLKWPAQG